MENQNNNPSGQGLGKERQNDKVNGMEMSSAASEGQTDGNIMDKAGEAGRSFIDQAKSTAGDAYQAATAKASTLVEDKKSVLTTGLTDVAHTIRRAGDAINEGNDTNKVAEYAVEYTGQAADKLEQVANYFERTDLKAAARDLESFARQNPAIFLGAAFALGIMAARFIKSTSPDDGNGAYIASAGSNQPAPSNSAAASV